MVSLSASKREKSLLASDGAKTGGFKLRRKTAKWEKIAMRAAQVQDKRVHEMLRNKEPGWLAAAFTWRFCACNSVREEGCSPSIRCERDTRV